LAANDFVLIAGKRREERKSKEGEEAREGRKRYEGEMRRWRARLLEPDWLKNLKFWKWRV
jgi:hypothetical protein